METDGLAIRRGERVSLGRRRREEEEREGRGGRGGERENETYADLGSSVPSGKCEKREKESEERLFIVEERKREG